MMRKRPFLLLEVLIAFTLVSLTFSVLVYSHFNLAREERALLEKMALERVADLSFIEVLDKSHTEKTLGIWAQLEPFEIYLKDQRCVFRRNYIVAYTSREKKEGDNVRSADVWIELFQEGKPQHQYHYGVLIECVS